MTGRLEEASQARREAEVIRAQRRKAAAFETMAGLLMMAYLNEYEESWGVEALHREARFHGRGGDR